MHLHNYLLGIDNVELKQTINTTSNYFLRKIIDNFDAEDNQINGLLLGHVQSGKTSQMFGIISAMADVQYKIFILLTTDNTDLQRQTYNRAKESLKTFNVLNEKDEFLLNALTLSKPTIIVLKKNSRILSKWKNHLLNTNICKGLVLTIFDDEADTASLNTLVNKNRVSTINRRLSEIKKTAAKNIYIEVTATPQAIILQTEISGWKPMFVYYFAPGTKYFGGNYFYPKTKSLLTKYTPEYELDDIAYGGDIICPIGLSRSIYSYLINCAHRKINGIMNCNFMVHPSIRISIHSAFVNAIQEHLTLLQKSTEDEAFISNLLNEWIDLQQTKPDLEAFEDIRERVVEILDNTEVMVIPLNSKSFICRDSNNPDALDLSTGYNIIVGGNTLGRGITFPNLQTVYYCRSSKVPQADTYWQHSRIFGYDREIGMVRLFIPEGLYKQFSELNESNEILIKQIENSQENIQLIFPNNIRPTRKNVIDSNFLNLLHGGVNMFASLPITANVDTINSLIGDYANETNMDVEADLILRLLQLARSESSEDFDATKFIACIHALKSKRPQIKCKLIVRIDRDITKNTGTLLSPNDRKLSDSFKNEIVLTMYRMRGGIAKGCSGKPLWIPNIKFLNDCCFYSIKNPLNE